jgi:hypothetical protein
MRARGPQDRGYRLRIRETSANRAANFVVDLIETPTDQPRSLPPSRVANRRRHVGPRSVSHLLAQLRVDKFLGRVCLLRAGNENVGEIFRDAEVLQNKPQAPVEV